MQTKVPHTNKPRTFRPWPENQMHFDFAERSGVNVSEVLNQIVAKHFKRQCQQNAQAQIKAMNSIAPARGTKPQLTKSRR